MKLKSALKKILSHRLCYILLLVLFSILLIADIAVYALSPSPSSPAGFSQNAVSPGFDAGDGRQPERSDAQSIPSMPYGDSSVPAGESLSGGFSGQIKRAFLPILLVCLLADGACVYMLRRRCAASSEKAAPPMPAVPDDHELAHASLWRRDPKLCISLAVLAGLVVLIIAMLPDGSDSASQIIAEEELISGLVETRDIDAVFYGSGSLSNNDAEEITVPDTVEILSYAVENGDAVSSGDFLAKVDKSSVLKTAASLQSELLSLDAALQSASSDAISSSLTSLASGRIMALFAESGDSVLDVMYEHGALALLSLDGLMAADIETGETLFLGDAVSLVRADGSELEASVSRIEDGVVTVTVSDSLVQYGEEVSVKTADGKTLGRAALRINSELKITGFSGTVSSVHVSEGREVYSGQALMTLSDLSYSGNYSALLKQRDAYSSLMERLLAMYRDGYIRAEYDGIVTGVPDGAEYEAIAAAGLSASSLSSAGGIKPLANSLSGAPALTLLSSAGVSLISDSEPLPTPEPTSAPPLDPEPTPAPEPTASPSPGLPATYSVSGTVEALSADSIKLLGISAFAVTADTVIDDGVAVGASVVLSFDASTGSLLSVSLVSSPSGGTDDQGGFGGQGGMPNMGGMDAVSSSVSEAEPEFSLNEVIVCSLIPEDIVTVCVSVDELDVLSLSVGQQADVSLDALPGQSFSGVVSALNTIGNNEGGSTKYTMTVTLERTALMFDGMNASVRIVTGTVRDALSIPAAAVYESGNRLLVYTSCDSRSGELRSPVEISTGASDGEYVQILSGLSLGDSYFYEYAGKLRYSFA